jgi:hypothetical protein
MCQHRWIITKGGQPAGKSGRVGPGAVKKARETRERQLQRDLAKARRERLARAVAGDFDVRAPGGAKVERLVTQKPSAQVEWGPAVIVDPPLSRVSRSKQLRDGQAPGERVEYAKDIVGGPVVVNGRVRPRGDVGSGGTYPGADVRPL